MPDEHNRCCSPDALKNFIALRGRVVGIEARVTWAPIALETDASSMTVMAKRKIRNLLLWNLDGKCWAKNEVIMTLVPIKYDAKLRNYYFNSNIERLYY